ncbi:ABC transporter substrate-binding protein [Nocardioides marmoriginsengisoli]|uniref:ABC transporter substrate-binding protein n=1 Tax=Nocardioides marmoriginsengisoli TaxID=661483 RepID=A0A3N0CJZ2_9ACTN|nr:ABC transporter substrate-binding protein [Nocardioides marmoriginsengisoli]RNL63765.1 ABC transporter substrate-binding protein [Nocardioides marmoriginsengisoli]
MFRSLAVAGLATVSLVLSACGSDSGSSNNDAKGDTASVFPVTVEHRLGKTVVPAKPERVVVVGLTEQDILLELGIVPVATTEWYGEQPSAVWPWAQELLKGEKPTVLSNSDGIQFEKIAALDPDLIIGTNSGVTKDDYAKLSKLAPTITNVKGGTDYFSAWQDQTRIIAEAVGLKEKGEELISRVETAYADAKKAHPEFAELTATFSQGAPYDGILYVYPKGLGTDFLSELGFQMTPGLEKYAPEAGSQAEISAENVNLIDADVMVFATESADMFGELQRWSTIGNLGAVKGNKAIYTDETLAGAIYFLTPLSQMYVLEKLLPQLEKAAAGEAPREFPKA